MNLTQLHGIKIYFQALGDWGMVRHIEGTITRLGESMAIDLELKNILLARIIELEAWKERLLELDAAEGDVYGGFLKHLNNSQRSAQLALNELADLNDWEREEIQLLKTKAA